MGLHKEVPERNQVAGFGLLCGVRKLSPSQPDSARVCLLRDPESPALLLRMGVRRRGGQRW